MARSYPSPAERTVASECPADGHQAAQGLGQRPIGANVSRKLCDAHF